MRERVVYGDHINCTVIAAPFSTSCIPKLVKDRKTGLQGERELLLKEKDARPYSECAVAERGNGTGILSYSSVGRALPCYPTWRSRHC